ncbi:nitrogen regulatory IIA protein [Sphingobacterium siyangense]|uniref:Nitrogen regulatory IIA protein n=1 Tax=Sphingobacterium siyangense TaxID=459529 RepID=A0A562MKC1_9SPHI|nr:nitrogen regulatory IIA protein [Sphingobacterium siyangense]TWI20316.1 hypothetical protein IQ31_02271 [Sphingobacterium siyangense]
MKKIRNSIDNWMNDLDFRWRELPIKKQHRYTLYFFLGYLLLTSGVIVKILYDTESSDNGLKIEHIKNPVIKTREPSKQLQLQDSITTVLKNKLYERE